ncbi:MAG: tripartite tricarboxylate transporter substrate binding protein [Betaproteobacteria bacterium]|nr:tripartite tricarboxylate transporter substrate binding protein [Betaproteobacteria bacterium]MSQ87680.1 tripartite tricarboxylate transporter substrate binding protein [Betaproteobacteria bacterium]
MKTAKLWAARLILAGTASVLLTQGAYAQTYPTKPIRLVMPYPPGGSSDILARPIANEMSKSLGQPVMIEYKPGAGSTIGADFIAKSAPDGHTLVMLLTAHAINATLLTSLPYDTLKDFTSITLAATLPLVVVVNAQSKIHSVQELIAAAKNNPGKLNYGSAGTGNTSHLAVEYFKSVVGVDMAHVPYKGSGPMVAALLGREIDLMFDSLSSSLAQIQAGKFRALGVSTAKRSHVAPQVPTIQEAGLPGFDISVWYGIFAAANTPAPIVQRLNMEFIKAMAAPEAKQRIEDYGYQIVGSTPAQLDAHVKSEIARWGKVIRDSGAKAN